MWQGWKWLVLGLLLLGCSRHPDRAAMTAEILQLHQTLIDAHIQQKPDVLFDTIAEDYVAVANGDVQFRQKDEFRAALGEYIQSTHFTEYRDLREPIVGFSDDGSLAWSIVQVKVAGGRRPTARSGCWTSPAPGSPSTAAQTAVGSGSRRPRASNRRIERIPWTQLGHPTVSIFENADGVTDPVAWRSA